jgi:hypothetical protein
LTLNWRTELELKQIAHPQLSLEIVNRKIADDRNAELGRNHCVLARLPADQESERQKQPARLVVHWRPIVQSNVRAGVEREEQAVRQIDVEGGRNAQVPQHAAVVKYEEQLADRVLLQTWREWLQRQTREVAEAEAIAMMEECPRTTIDIAGVLAVSGARP